MRMQALGRRSFAFVCGVALLAFSDWAGADPPSRAARLGYLAGAVSFSPAGEDDWVQATVNRPLTTGDRLWAESRARAEIQMGAATLRLDAGTGVSILNFDDRTAQLQLTQGRLNVRLRRLAPGQVFEVDTPNLAFAPQEPGEYRIDVDPDHDSTTIFVRSGRGEAYGDGAAYVVDSRQPYRFTGTDLRVYEPVGLPPPDEFDRWSHDRDRAFDTSVSARYVSPDVVGYQDLDANGTWRVDATYGNVWIPARVSAGWAPYRDGHWAWIDPWGWTWVDDAPWGFAVSHYGRWANLGGAWGWVPGPVRAPAYYAPALVVFVGGANFQLTISSGNVGGVAWFPLGPREVYSPSYLVSRGYFENVNRSNTVISNTVINNTYNTTNVTNIVYVNRRVPGAVVAVPTTAFVQSQPVARAAVRIDQDTIASRSGEAAPSVAPSEKSVRGAAAQRDKPPARVFDHPVLARTAPPTPHAGFAAQQQQLTERPGKPLDDAARKELRPATTAPAPVVKVVVPAQEAPRTLRPPPEQRVPSDQREQSDPRGQSEQRRPAEQRAQPVTPAPSQAAPAARQPAQREQPVQRERPAQREQPQPAPAGKQTEPRPPAAAARPAPPEAVQRSASRAQAPVPAASRPDDKRDEPDKRERDGPERGAENRKPRN